jgi:hypothetical protein
MHLLDIRLHLFGIVVALSVVLVIAQQTCRFLFRRIRAQKRKQALMAAAQAIGFTFQGDDWNHQPEEHQLGTALFSEGRSRRFNNIMIGTAAGLKTSIFDYSYITTGSQNTPKHTQTVAAFSGNLCLPLFVLAPKGFADRIVDAVSHQNVDFESHPDFAGRYVLHATPPVLFPHAPTPQDEDNKIKIRELFSPALLTFLQALPPQTFEWNIEGCGATLILYRAGRITLPDGLRSFLDETGSIARTFFSLCGLKKPTA